MMKRNVIAALAAVCTICACTFDVPVMAAPATPATTSTAAETVSGSAITTGEETGIEKVTFSTKTYKKTYKTKVTVKKGKKKITKTCRYKTLSYKYPVLKAESDASSIQKINKYLVSEKNKWVKENTSSLKQDKKDYIDYAKISYKYSKEFPFSYYGNEQAYEITYNKNGIISILCSGYEYPAGAAHGMPYNVSYTFDLNTGELLTLSDLFSVNDKAVQKLIVSAASETINKNPVEYWDNAINIVKESASIQNTNFYLDKNGVVFYYAPYELAPYASGTQFFTVPFTTKDTFKRNL
ncbi:MAG: DUF3298 and DUF4163 domain-containing protein [Clostridiales bacterium]|nr:DUF3298 and DUF4163 domain-containing protein [Clostridiales bacterium]